MSEPESKPATAGNANVNLCLVAAVFFAIFAAGSYMLAYQNAQPDAIDVMLGREDRGPGLADVDKVLVGSPLTMLLGAAAVALFIAWIVMRQRATETA